MAGRAGEVYPSLGYAEMSTHVHAGPHDVDDYNPTPVSPTIVKMIGRLVTGSWVEWESEGPDPTGAQYTGGGTLDTSTISVC